MISIQTTFVVVWQMQYVALLSPYQMIIMVEQLLIEKYSATLMLHIAVLAAFVSILSLILITVAWPTGGWVKHFFAISIKMCSDEYKL
jgi:hypothetical protein